MDAITFQAEALKLEKLLYHISWSMLGNNEDCADAVQEALLKAWQKRDTLKSRRAFRPWLTRILYNDCIDILRNRKHLVQEELHENDLPVQPPKGADDDLLLALQTLSAEQRTAAVLHYIKGYKLKEISAMLGISLNTVKSRVMYARVRMKQKYLNQEHEGSGY
ncbi:MAG: RNA polymerase sigma factor [Firmicutes bacterium]|nr:RNA polymerase sigma factor [Bacillota bacterium]